MTAAIFFTAFQIAWAAWWAALHGQIRRARGYSSGREKASSDHFYRVASPFLYLMQNGLCIASFWSSAPWLLKFHDSDTGRVLGVILFCLGSWLYRWALRHLGANYSPCYDTHLPKIIVTTGPYRWMRHPMYIGKLLIGAATVVVSGSFWFVPTTFYFYGATLKAMWREDKHLAVLPSYQDYRRGQV
jgi:protein-S-isoprenylcysteine O-methyltransferase Ste14